MEVRQPFLGEQVERERDARGQADAARAFAQLPDVLVGIRVRRRREQLAREPEDALRLVRYHQLVHDLLEVGQHLDLGERFRGFRRHDGNLVGETPAGQRVSPRSHGIPTANREPLAELPVFTSRVAAGTFPR